eukprot:COSAG05_NODE_695_length_7888_cov_3936.037746_1_plen_85_part_00
MEPLYTHWRSLAAATDAALLAAVPLPAECRRSASAMELVCCCCFSKKEGGYTREDLAAWQDDEEEDWGDYGKDKRDEEERVLYA